MAAKRHKLICANDGFTLIELLVVIAIIALLMAILVPAFHKVRSQARSIACRSNLHQWAFLLHAYTDDNDGKWFDLRINKNPRWYWMGENVRKVWPSHMYPYWNNCDDVFLCPEASKYVRRPDDTGLGFTFSAWRFIFVPPGDYIVGSYGLNAWVYNTRPHKHRHHVNHPEPEWWRTPPVKGADNIPVLSDATLPYNTPFWAGILQGGGHWYPPDHKSDFENRCVINRHNGGINMLFMDWSVRKVGLKELWTLKWHRYFNTANRLTKAGGVRREDWPEWMRKFKDY